LPVERGVTVVISGGIDTNEAGVPQSKYRAYDFGNTQFAEIMFQYIAKNGEIPDKPTTVFMDNGDGIMDAGDLVYILNDDETYHFVPFSAFLQKSI